MARQCKDLFISSQRILPLNFLKKRLHHCGKVFTFQMSKKKKKKSYQFQTMNDQVEKIDGLRVSDIKTDNINLMSENPYQKI